MNYLAHLYLAGEDPERLLGSLMGDFVKGRLDGSYAEGVREGIVLHRKVDAYTDAHPLVRRSKARMRPPFRRYAGILVDVYYDHFLARNWSLYSEVSLRAYTHAVYRLLDARYAGLPPRMQRSVSHMIATDLLYSYRELAGVGRALRGIEGRLKRESRLGEAVADLELNYAPLAADFAAFFPELIAFARTRPERG